MPLDNTQLLDRLVRFNTVSKNSNCDIADFICEYLDGRASLIYRDISDDGAKINLLIRIGPAPRSDQPGGLVLSGHLDTVPAEEPQWQSDPFTLVHESDRYVGRGSADMKGFVAIAINAAHTIDPMTLKRPLYLLLTRDEEVGTVGAQHFVDNWDGRETLPKQAIIGEPTELRAIHAHKGHVRYRLTLEGISAHSGYPHLGKNAITLAGRAIQALDTLAHTMRSERPTHADLFVDGPFVPLNIGTIRGGAAVNVVPDHCQIEFGSRPLPGIETDTLTDRIADALGTALNGEDYSLELLNLSPPLLLAQDAPIHTYVQRLVHQHTCHSVSYATDAGWFQKLGMQCVVFGPGSIEVAHKPNEYMPKDQFVRAAQLVSRAIDDHCIHI